MDIKHAVFAGLERGPLPRKADVTLARYSPRVQRPWVWRAASSVLGSTLCNCSHWCLKPRLNHLSWVHHDGCKV